MQPQNCRPACLPCLAVRSVIAYRISPALLSLSSTDQLGIKGVDANDVVRSWEAGMNAASPYHIGNTGAFEYPSYLFDSLMNLE